jgi:hypothetical protein
MAAKFFISGGSNNNWYDTTNWSLSSGGAGSAGIPTASDSVTFDTNSPNCNVNVNFNACTCASFVSTNYTNKITLSFMIFCQGNATFGANMTWAGSDYFITSGSVTITTNGNVLLNLKMSASPGTVTLADVVNVSGTLWTTGTITTSGNYINCSGSLMSASAYTGSTVNMTGTGTITGGGIYAEWYSVLVFNTAGTITMSGIFAIGTGTITYTAGTIVTTAATLQIENSCTLNTAGMTWAYIYINDLGGALNRTITLNSALSATKLESLQAQFTLAGSYGATIGTFIYDGGTGLTSTIVLAFGQTYTVNTELRLLGSYSIPLSLKSSSGGSQAKLTYNGSTQTVCFVNATDIDSSLGSTVYPYKGSISNTLNWIALAAPQTVAHTFCS